ncbi:YegS/Rv2252/BmrU family lipid kinase [Paenibacillus sp. FSL K6-1217]|uniref:diacylglycerol/lipid kinase family protein n=1 Tax=Paenibacillus sp. FSL K6-1217 TaxID=2921466 RepID=UPI0032555F47
MQQAMIIMNPSSGKAEARDYIRAVEEVLQGAGYQVAVHETAGEGDATAFCNQACSEKYDLVVAIGGDGTLHETMNGLANQQHRPKLGIVPMGTVNDFARALQIPLLPEEAIRTLSSSHTQRVDMGRLNDRLFANVVAAGSLAGSLSSVTTEDKTRLGFLAYLKEGIKELASNTAHTLTITHDGEIWEGSSPLFIAALTNSVGGFEKLAPAAAVDDGLLHCFIVKDLHLLNSVTVSISLLLGNLRNHKDVIYFTAKEVSVRSAEPVQTNVDGEQGPPLPITLSTIPRHIQVVVPEA